MKRFLDILNKIEVVGASLVLAGLIAFTFVGVPMRYLMSHPFTWEEELQLACMVWITFLAAPAAFRSKSHVAIEIVVDALPAGLRRGAEVLIALVVYGVLVYFLFRSRDFLAVMLKTNRKTPILMIPYSWIYSIAPVSIVLMLVSYTEEKIGELREMFRGREEEKR
ncbi:MAG: TRAP transporter small permease [Lachnospiraceae bacterium]|nr:TRAP transporter small permease [Lachnospiraceae bacterium]